jgi:hypothetical protein
LADGAEPLGDVVATAYPYVSSQSALVKAFEQFRKAFPPTIDAATLKRFSIAPANESYVINTFRFLGLIDDDGAKVDEVVDFFYGDDSKFQQGLEAVIRSSYKALFDDHGEAAWEEGQAGLATWFRVTDKTSDLVGGRQANTFRSLAALAGHGELKVSPSPPKSSNGAVRKPSSKPKSPATSNAAGPNLVGATQQPPVITTDSVGLTVRIEVNLPATGTADVYDAIFASIRRHLIDRV